MSQMIDFTVPSTVPGRTLHAFRCVPEGEVKAVLQLSHGMVEFIDRYKPLAEYLAGHPGRPGHLAAALAGKTLSCAGLRRTLTKPFITTADRRTECVLLRYEPDRRPAVCCRNSDAMPLRGNVWSM